jgi:hypothetical protein
MFEGEHLRYDSISIMTHKIRIKVIKIEIRNCQKGAGTGIKKGDMPREGSLICKMPSPCGGSFRNFGAERTAADRPLSLNLWVPNFCLIFRILSASYAKFTLCSVLKSLA